MILVLACALPRELWCWSLYVAWNLSITETHKDLKRVTRICRFWLMLVIKKTDQSISWTTWCNFTPSSPACSPACSKNGWQTGGKQADKAFKRWKDEAKRNTGFPFSFFSRSFLIFTVTSDWVLNQLRICIAYEFNFRRKRKELQGLERGVSKYCSLKINKLTSLFYASVLLLMINFVITLSKCCRFTSRSTNFRFSGLNPQ